MLKKVLSVVLALILALGVCVAAVSAYSYEDPADTLEEVLAQLPSEYNARFYNEDTEALILEARAAAEAALASGDQAQMNDAYALCSNAFYTAYDWDSTPDGMEYLVNRDESRAVADIYYSTSADSEYLKPGDEFDVTISLKTDFYIYTMNLGFAYDKNVFEYVPNSIVCGTGLDEYLDVENGAFSTAWGYKGTKEQDGGFPDTWTADMKAQYGLMEKVMGMGPDAEDFFMPTTKTDIVTFTLKVKDGIDDGVTGRIFADNNLCATRENGLLGTYYYPLIQFTRAYAPTVNEKTADIDGYIAEAWLCGDETAASGQTINIHNGDMTFTVGEPPVQLDYTALNAAIASIKDYTEEEYTADSWKDFADAVAAGTDEGLTATTQEAIDGYTAAIVDAREKLVNANQNSEILNITAVTEPVVKKICTLEILVKQPTNKEVSKLHFVNSAGNTLTYVRTHTDVQGIVDNGDGTETWTLNIPVYQMSETYMVYPKFDGEWSVNGYRYVLADTHVPDGNIYSYAITDAYIEKEGDDPRIKAGTHELKVISGLDVCKVQIQNNGRTTTYTTANATVEQVGDRLEWTINFNFNKLGNGLEYQFWARTATVGFTKSDVTAYVDVLC